MAVKPALTQFNGGEISPQLEGRTDWDKYNYSAKLCKTLFRWWKAALNAEAERILSHCESSSGR